MDKFYEQFKHNLENQPAPDFEAQDWADMQQRLDQQATVPAKPINYWTWVALALLLGIIGSNWLIIGELKQATQKISRLELQIDTIVQTKIIYRTDTIFQTMSGELFTLNAQKKRIYNLEENQTVESLTNKNTTSNFEKKITTENRKNTSITSLLSTQQKEKQASNKIIDNSDENSFSNKKNSAVITSIYSENHMGSASRTWSSGSTKPFRIKSTDLEKEKVETFAFQEPNESNDDFQKTASNFIGKQPIKNALLSKLSPSFEIIYFDKKRPLPKWFETPTVSIRRKKTFEQYIYPMRPQGIEIGATMGVGLTTTGNYSHVDLNNYGLLANIKFGQPWRLWIAANHTSFKYESKELGGQSGIPIIEPPLDNFKLEEAKVNRVFWSVDAGLQYNFSAQKKWQPYIGVGFGWSALVKNEVLYEFEKDKKGQGEQSIFEERSFEKAKNLQQAILKAGVSYRLSNKWSVQLEGNYLYQIENTNNPLPNMANGKLGILYAF